MDVQLVLLRSLLGELPLKPGSMMAARVIDARTIALAGVRMAATLPEGIEPGTNMHVRVREASNERLLLQIVPRAADDAAEAGPAAAPQLIPVSAPIPLPGGATARLLVDPDEASDEPGSGRGPRVQTVTLRYESAGVGRLDLALTVEPGATRAVAFGPAGDVAERLRAASADLRSALMSALDRPASVDVIARAEVLDVQA
jgi:hypothetical protein